MKGSDVKSLNIELLSHGWSRTEMRMRVRNSNGIILNVTAKLDLKGAMHHKFVWFAGPHRLSETYQNELNKLAAEVKAARDARAEILLKEIKHGR